MASVIDEAAKEIQQELFSATGLTPCPFCKTTSLSLVTIQPEGMERIPLTIQCDSCGATGPNGVSEDQIRALWDAR